jgi:hypothetical protein
VPAATLPPFDRWPAGVQYALCRPARAALVVLPSDIRATELRVWWRGVLRTAAAMKRAQMSGSEKQTTGAAFVRIIRAIIELHPWPRIGNEHSNAGDVDVRRCQVAIRISL